MTAKSHPTQPSRAVRCGIYEVDLHGGELRRSGLKVRLQDQPFSVLARLLSTPGELVTREELQAQLWGEHSRVDAELGLNTAIKKLRAAFRDSADNPRFIETLPKRGYRFIAPVIEIEQTPMAEPTGNTQPTESPRGQIPGPRALGEGFVVTDPLADRTLTQLQQQAAKCRPPWHKGLVVGGVLAFLGVIAGAGILAGRTNPASERSALAGRLGMSVYRQPRGPDGSAMGIGGYNLRSPGDLAFAFDYGHTGKSDHLVFYRPGTGIIWILRNVDGRFSPVFVGHGIGGYALKSGADRAFAFDYDHSGKQDHLVLYRLGTETICILKNEGEGVFTPVYQYSGSHSGSSPQNPDAPSQSLAFDYDHSGKLDYLVRYRPGGRSLEILSNIDGTFSPVSTVSVSGAGMAGAAMPAADQLFAFDYDHSGKLDHLLLYWPGEGKAVILKNTGGVFIAVYESHSIRSAEIDSAQDRALPFDYQHTGSLDHLLLYRPGTGLFRVWKNTAGTLSAAYSGIGIGGYNLMSPSDRVLAFDYDHTGKPDYLTLYRPGTGLVQIVRLP
jgi:DNA-binding winged helix-turn-helix (wHTH) protein